MIEKALIPIAGMGARLAPVSSVVPKAMFPLVDAAGEVRTVLHLICAEAVAAGANRVGLIVSPGQQELCEAYFRAAAQSGAADLPESIEYIIQPHPAGFGDAVASTEQFIDGQAFLLFLGDHVYVSDCSRGCGAQVADAFEVRGGAAMIGMQAVDAHELCRVGVATGEEMGDGVYRCTRFIEKPSRDEAASSLVTGGLTAGRYLAHCGIYAFTSEIFDCLAELSARGGEGELQLAGAQSILLKRHPRDYYLYRISGRAWDTGTPEGYGETFEAIRTKC